jgi:hypothetical protein
MTDMFGITCSFFLVEVWRAYLDYSQFNSERLDVSSQLGLRVDKNFFFGNWMLGLYFDIQNALGRTYNQPPSLIQETNDAGEPIIVNPGAAPEDQRYQMKYLNQASGTVLPTLGIMIEF